VVLESAAGARVADLNGVPAGYDWAALVILLAGAAVIGLAVFPRLSPLASLIPGVLLGALGVVWATDPTWAVEHSTKEFLPPDLRLGYMVLGANGIFLIIGVALTVASLSPRRWRGDRPPAPAAAAPRETDAGEDVVES
jgi:hypothetical protein